MARILIVEDHPDQRQIYAGILNYNGFEVDEAGDVIEAINLMQSRTPDAIPMDIILPGTSGLDAAEGRMRALTLTVLSTAVLSFSGFLVAQRPARTLLLVAAHADDESIVGPVRARYAREGVQVYMLVVTDGAQGGANTSIPRGPELARVRAEELDARLRLSASGSNRS